MAEPTILLEGRGIDKFFGKGRQRRQVLFGVDITGLPRGSASP